MMPLSPWSLFRAGFVTAFLILAQSASAEKMRGPDGFPQRPLSITVPAGAGGGSDQVSRAMATAIDEVAEIDVQVINKPGGNGTVAQASYLAMPKDGYGLLQHTDTIVSSYVSGQAESDPSIDLIPIAITQMTFSQIYVRSGDERFRSFEQLLAYAKANPGKLTIANISSEGSMERVNMQNLSKALGITVQQVSFDKPAERYAALLGGHVDAMFEQPGDVRNFVDGGQFTPVLTLLRERPGPFAEVPSLADVGADFTPLNRYRGFWVHGQAPAERVAFLRTLFSKAFESESYQAFNRSKYMHLVRSFYTGDDAIALLRDEIDAYRAAYKAMGKTQ